MRKGGEKKAWSRVEDGGREEIGRGKEGEELEMAEGRGEENSERRREIGTDKCQTHRYILHFSVLNGH